MCIDAAKKRALIALMRSGDKFRSQYINQQLFQKYENTLKPEALAMARE